MTNSATSATKTVPNGKCLFGRMHTWLTKGTVVSGHKVYICTCCGLVCGTGQKVNLNEGGALFLAEPIVAAHYAEVA